MTESIVFDFYAVMADVVWRPFVGARWIWWISAAHFLAACVCIRAGQRETALERRDRSSKLPIFWFVLATFMFVLFLNKLFDLQSLLTVMLRKTARDDGWYFQRRTFQKIFVWISIVMGIVGLLGSWLVLRVRWKERSLAYAAAVFLLTLIVIRTASYHPVDEFLYLHPVAGNRVNAGLELAGAVLVGLGALWSLRQTGTGRRGA